MKRILLLLTLSIFLHAQNRVLLHIDQDGKQEAIPLTKGEQAQNVIGHREQTRTTFLNKPSSVLGLGLIDVLKNYPEDAVFGTHITLSHQDAFLQWFVPNAGGKVKEFWWRNDSKQGAIKKGTIRAWYVDPKLATRPASVISKYLGAYKDPTDGDGFVTPFRPEFGDRWFYGNGAADSATWRFDPLGSEVSTWKPGGVQVALDSGKWQGISLEAWGDSMFVNQGQLFGFTLSNDSKVKDTISGDTPMEIFTWPNKNPAPFHSLKWYETGRISAADKGWHLRGDYEWGMYVVIEYTKDRSPKIELQGEVKTTLQNFARPITVKVTDDNPDGGNSGVKSVYLKTKIGTLASYDSTVVLGNGSTYTGFASAGNYGDTIYWQFVASDMNGNRTVLGPRTYVIFKRKKCNLFLYNNNMFALGNSGGNLIYNSASKEFDGWSTINDGIGELDALLAMYNKVVLADGNYPARNVYPTIKSWMDKGTPSAKKILFFTSQDYGCFINKTCNDTTFTAGTFEYDYLGIQTLGPQNLGPTNRPYKIVPLADPATNYLIKYNMDSSTTLWHHPTFELTSTFLGSPDAISLKTGAKAIFTNDVGTHIHGVVNFTNATYTMFVAFDAGALQFRSDTSTTKYALPTNDPKYQWIVDYQPLSIEFLRCVCYDPCIIDGIETENVTSLPNISLEQNYPNPFNTTTVISYQIPKTNFVNLKIFDLLGREVARLVNEEQKEGKHTIRFDAKNLSSGLYFYRLQSGNFVAVKKMMLLK